MIAAIPGETLIASLLSLKRAGRSVTLVQVGGEAAPSGRGNLVTYRVADDVNWQKMEVLSLRKVMS